MKRTILGYTLLFLPFLIIAFTPMNNTTTVALLIVTAFAEAIGAIAAYLILRD